VPRSPSTNTPSSTEQREKTEALIPKMRKSKTRQTLIPISTRKIKQRNEERGVGAMTVETVVDGHLLE
jgi:hypothetical protein